MNDTKLLSYFEELTREIQKSEDRILQGFSKEKTDNPLDKIKQQIKDNQLEVGDLVQLNSGSIPMTVVAVSAWVCCCVYYDEKTSEFKNETFQLKLLKKWNSYEDITI